MVTTAVLGDLHIREPDLEELNQIFGALLPQINEVERVIFLGDIFDKSKPTPKELEFASSILSQLKRNNKEVIIIEGNHDISCNDNALAFLVHWGVSVKESFVDENNRFYGHFFVKETPLNGNTVVKSIKELGEFKNVILGHFHDFTYLNIDATSFHLGSIYYTSFGESENIPKYYLVIKDNIEKRVVPNVIPIATITDLNSLHEEDFRLKVRLLTNSYQSLIDNATTISDIIKEKRFHSFKQTFIRPDINLELGEKEKGVYLGFREFLLAFYLPSIDCPHEVEQCLLENYDS